MPVCAYKSDKAIDKDKEQEEAEEFANMLT
jgi:hypothetical protein